MTCSDLQIHTSNYVILSTIIEEPQIRKSDYTLSLSHSSYIRMYVHITLIEGVLFEESFVEGSQVYSYIPKKLTGSYHLSIVHVGHGRGTVEFVGGSHSQLTAAVAAKGKDLTHLGDKEVTPAWVILAKIGDTAIRDH